MKNQGYRVALIGASGVIGKELLCLLKKHAFPLEELRCFASKKKTIDDQLIAYPLAENSFDDIDLAFFAAGKEVSKKWIPLALKCDVTCIDLSSLYRLDPNVPLIIPEINGELINNKLIASPNCTTTFMLMALAPLHRAFKLKRIIASTYQAVSGSGHAALQKLKDQTQDTLNNKSITTSPHYAFNLFLHDSPVNDEGYNDEERKMHDETHKILNAPDIEISVTCVRVPTFRVHALSITATFENAITPNQAMELLVNMPGIILDANATPESLAGKEQVAIARIRQPSFCNKTLEFWVLGDQLLKGGALNAVQIAQIITKENLCHSH